MLPNFVPRTFATLRLAAHRVPASRQGNALSPWPEFATLEDRILFNVGPAGAALDGAAVAGGDGSDSGGADGKWIIVEDYSGSSTDVHDPQSGGWDVAEGEYHATPGSDAISTLLLDGPLGENLELEVSFNADNASGPNLSNAFVIFDYQTATDFKFAGAYVGVDQWVIGHRTAADWVTDAFVVAPINGMTDYQLTLKVAGDSQVTLEADGSPVLTHTFADSVTDGELGVGTKSAFARFDDLRLRFLPSDTGGTAGELPLFEDFDDAVANHFSPAEGDWQLVDGEYQVTPEVGEAGASLLLLSDGVPDDVEIGVNFNADPIIPHRFTNGVVIFDYQSDTDFKYAGGFINRDEWVIGQKVGDNWVDDVVVDATLEPLTAYDMRIVIEDGSTVTLFTADTILASHTFGESVTDGSIGLGSDNSVTRFDNFSVTDLSPVVSNVLASWDGRDLVVSGHAAGELLVQAQSARLFDIFDGDELLYDDLHVKGNLRFELGGWDDHVTLDLNGHEFRKNVFGDLGGGDNYFAIVNGAIGKNFRLVAGGGMDEVAIADHAMIGKSVVVDLGDGSNQFTASQSKIGGHLRVTGGADQDQISLNDVYVRRNTVASLGDGWNQFSVEDSKVGGNVKVFGGMNHDWVSVENSRVDGTLRADVGDGENDVQVANAKVGGHLRVLGGSDHDRVAIEDVFVHRDVVARLGDGANAFALADAGIRGRLHVAGGSDVDHVAIEDARVCGQMVAKLGDGDNTFSLAESKVYGDLKVRTGDGADDISIGEDANVYRSAKIVTGDGDDVIDVAGKVRWSLNVRAGGGEDTLTVSGRVCGYSCIHLGAGDDVVEVAEDGSLGHYAKVKLGAGDDTFTGPGKYSWRWDVHGGRGDDTIEWTGNSHRHWRGWWWC